MSRHSQSLMVPVIASAHSAPSVSWTGTHSTSAERILRHRASQRSSSGTGGPACPRASVRDALRERPACDSAFLDRCLPIGVVGARARWETVHPARCRALRRHGAILGRNGARPAVARRAREHARVAARAVRGACERALRALHRCGRDDAHPGDGDAWFATVAGNVPARSSSRPRSGSCARASDRTRRSARWRCRA